MSFLSSPHLPPLLYTLALSSLSVHLLYQRRAATTSRNQLSARISVLDDLAARLRAGEPVRAEEAARLRRLATAAERGAQADGAPEREVGWMEVILGRDEAKQEAGETGDRGGRGARVSAEEWDRRDLEGGESRAFHSASVMEARITLVLVILTWFFFFFLQWRERCGRRVRIHDLCSVFLCHIYFA